MKVVLAAMLLALMLLPVYSMECREVGVNGTLYSDTVLSQDLVSSGDCLSFGADNVTLDCAGHRLVGTGGGTGIYIFSRHGIKVKDCAVEKFNYGLKVSYSDSSYFEGNSFKNCYIGVYLSTSSELLFSKNTADSNGQGVYAYDVSGVDFIDGRASGNRGHGFELKSSFWTNIKRNDFSSNRIGVGVYSSSEVEVSENDLRSCYKGYEEESVRKVILSGNANDIISGNAWDSIVSNVKWAIAIVLILAFLTWMASIIGKGQKKKDSRFDLLWAWDRIKGNR